MHKAVIDRFTIPAASTERFLERGAPIRALLASLPGFVRMSAYSRVEDKNLQFVTIAVWENEGAIADASTAIAEAYRREGFDGERFFRELGVKLERGIFDER